MYNLMIIILTFYSPLEEGILRRGRSGYFYE